MNATFVARAALLDASLAAGLKSMRVEVRRRNLIGPARMARSPLASRRSSATTCSLDRAIIPACFGRRSNVSNGASSMPSLAATATRRRDRRGCLATFRGESGLGPSDGVR